jgi:mono/diheme cytochrome c family protein
MRLAIVAVTLLLAAGSAAGTEHSVTLPDDHVYGTLTPGPGAEVTRNRCAVCHSTDYIVMQPGGDARQWQGVVTKMIKVFGAPIDDDEARTIVEYLGSAYGPPK